MMPQKDPQQPEGALPQEPETETPTDTPKTGGLVRRIINTTAPLAAITAGLTAGCSPSPTQPPTPAVREAAERLPAVQEETRRALHRIGVFAPELRDGAVHCTYNGRAYALIVDGGGNMQELRNGNFSAAFPTPIAHERIGSVICTFDTILSRHASRQESDRAFAERLGPNPRFTDSDGNRFFFETGEGEGRKKYCVTPLDILEVTREPSPEDFANWQQKENDHNAAWQACCTFKKRHGKEPEKLPSDALRNEYRMLSQQWLTAYYAVHPARTRCITILQHPDYGEVRDRPYSVEPRKRHIFVRIYKKAGMDTEDWYWEDGINSRTTVIGPRLTRREQWRNWTKGETEEYFYDNAWKRHTVWSEKYRPNGTRIFRREGNTIRYFGQDNRTEIARGEFRKNAKEREYVADVHLIVPDGKGNSRDIRTYRQHRDTKPKLTPEEYVRDVAPSLAHDPHLLQRYFHLYWRYTPDRTPDPKKLEDRWKPGNTFWPGEFRQTIHQTLSERKEGIPVEADQAPASLFGDCDDLAELAAYLLQSQGIRAYNIGIHFENADRSRSGHAICFWLEQRPDGRWNARSQCTGGAMKNGLPLDECPENHQGYANPQECFRALEEFYGRYGLRVVSCCRDSEQGMNLQQIWHIRPDDTGPDQTLTIEDFVPAENRPLPPPPEPARLKGLLERMGLPTALIALSSLPVGYLFLRWRKRKNQRPEQTDMEPNIPLHITFHTLPKPKCGETYPDSKGVSWTVVEWDPPDIRLKMPVTIFGSLQHDGEDFFFVANIPLKSGKNLHVEFRTPIDGKKMKPRKKKSENTKKKPKTRRERPS